MTRAPRGDRLLRACVVLAAASAYVTTAARHVLGGDNGEFATLAVTGGVAHPPGYPLYVLYLRALSWLPATSPAHNASLSTALLGIAAVALLWRASFAWGASAFAASLVSAVYAFAPLTWQLATHAETFTLNAVVALAIVTLAAPSCTVSPAKRVALLGLFAGLGLSNHHSIVLLAPIGLFAVIHGVRAASRPAVAAASGVGALLLGLTPYTYLVYEARYGSDAAWTWGDPRDLASLWRHFSRADYGTTELGISTFARQPVAQWTALATRLATDYLGLPIVGLLGLAFALARHRNAVRTPALSRHGRHGHHARHAWLALVATFVLSGPVFVSWFNLPPRDIGALIVERFYLLPAAILCVLVAPAIDRLLPSLPSRPALGAAMTLLTATVAALLAFPDVREHHRPTVELYVRNVLRIVPADAIVAGTGDHRFGAFLYARYALGLRPDVVFVNPRLLLGDWYPPRVSRLLGFDVVHGEARVLDAAALTSQLLATQRPLFFTDWFAHGLEASAPSYPVGPLVRITPRRSDVPSPDALFALNESVDARLELEATPPRRHTWEGDLAADYARPWQVLAEAFKRQGNAEYAARCERRARELAPWLADHGGTPLGRLDGLRQP